MIDKVFVYGSLRTRCYNYEKYLKDKVKYFQRAIIEGKLYHIENKGYPAAIHGEGIVYGELMEFYDYKEVIKILDDLEEYNENNINNSMYIREKVEVTLLDGSKEIAYVYIYNKECKENKLDKLIEVPNNDWIKYM